MPNERKRKRLDFTIATLISAALLAAVGITALAQDDSGGMPQPGASPSASASPAASPAASPSAQPSPSPTLATQRQVFIAQLNGVNGSGASGTARIVVDGETMGIQIEASGLAPGVMHEQHIHGGSQCPGFSADQNGDGFVDSREAEPIAGPIVFPLSLDLPRQTGTAENGAAGQAGNFPIASATGTVNYIQASPLSAILNALSQPGAAGASPSPTATATPGESPSPTGTLEILGSNPGSAVPTEAPGATPQPSPTESPGASPTATATPGASPTGTMGIAGNLESRVIEIHGIDSSTNLPPTVQSDSGKPAQVTLPVACGVIVRTQE
ncbi:MAG: hypothetical protein A2428_15220 [Bdellovibrionales bacterium RIFOXYC1_FULL_54_43]|nr:MAG: hypothetical protein A2428_15220 [Bdellovibrionales bacterium RIFOXYC1_FULL_54_43]OFZ78423.1 MAG: hypothetical protein A2603_09460 [Bdellovibrionales bacterium RIFOXYD1_FULL_55_31]